MPANKVALTLAGLLVVGAGCAAPKLPELAIFPQDVASADLKLESGTKIILEQTDVNPLRNLGRQQAREIVLRSWETGEGVSLTWSEVFERETAASLESRTAAERATGVGEESHVPEPVYETISLNGSLTTDALDDGQRILLPSEWTETQVDLSGSSSTLIWLSQTQYNELAATRHTHLSIGMFDAGLQTAADAAQALKGFITQLSGGDDSGSITDQDVTEIVASADWGSYTLKWKGEKVRVQTVQAENKFASYTILANPENPLILEVELKAWAYGTEALGFLSDELQISGYAITEITSP
jgi:hypothetical protein